MVLGFITAQDLVLLVEYNSFFQGIHRALSTFDPYFGYATDVRVLNLAMKNQPVCQKVGIGVLKPFILLWNVCIAEQGSSLIGKRDSDFLIYQF